MNMRHSLPSSIYRVSPSDDACEVSRENKIGTAIELSVDRIFMALYCRRSVSIRAVSPVRKAIYGIRPLLQSLLKGVQLNSLETSVLHDLDALGNSILNDVTVLRLFTSTAGIETLLNQISSDSPGISSVIKMVRFVLAIANQIDYNDTSIVVPCIHILPTDAPYAKNITQFNLGFKLERDMIDSSKDLWYRIFKGLRFNSYNKDLNRVLPLLCATINIGMIPDIGTGIGVTRFYYEEYLASSIRARFIDQSKGFITDFNMIHNILTLNNPWMDKSVDLTNIGSLEAASDSVPEDDTSTATDNGGTADPPPDDATDTPDTTDAPDNSTGDQIATDDPNADPADNSVDDGTGADATSEDDPLNGGLDNTDKPKPLLLGLNIALPKDETLDEFMYKVSVARFIDNVIEFNHDELPLETVTTLTQWKSSMLFLTDAGETKRLLKTLHIKTK